ncbi:MAG TPA: sulfatase [Thermoanaerobaculia bacterium]|nr:sulfatase [Thermoanaerobaculia bacterium]
MRTSAVWAAALALTLAACSQQPAPPKRVPVVHSLATELPAAELHREIGTIDFGTAEARPFLVDGWYQNEGGGARPTIVWSRGRSSALEIWLAAPRPLRAEIRCAPFEPPDGQPQVVTVELNGQQAGALSLKPRLNDYTIELPVAAQVSGRNRLLFRYRKETRFDRRHLAVSWDLLRLRPGRPSPAGLPRAEQRTGGKATALFIPVGSEATFYFPVEETGTFSIDGVRVQGSGGKLLVIARRDGGAEEVLETIEGSRGPRSLELPGQGSRLVEIALRAVPGSAAATGGFQLLAPAVRTLEIQRTAAAGASGSGGTERPNVIIYLVDTLRADHVGTYGGGSLTPNIDAFARDATVFENTVAQAPWTKPSVAAIFTGRGPLSHGVRLLHDKLPQEAVTLAELLSARGYQTAAFSTNWHIRNETGMDQGFGFFDFSPDEAESNKLNQRLFRWLDNQAKAPFFLYAHALDPHEPYTPPKEYRDKYAPDVRPEAGYDFDLKRVDVSRGKERRQYMAEMRELYDGEVAFNDFSFGAFLKTLRERGLYDRSLILFVADHGEELDEHGARGHTSHLYAETLNVPLIVKWPGQRHGQRVASIAQHIDILPTLLRVAGAEAPQGLPGMDLAAVAASGDDPEALSGRWVLSHLSHRDRVGFSLIHAGWKLVYPQTPALAPGIELYHRADDRGETRNRINEAPVRAGWLSMLIRAESERSRKSGLKPEHVKIDEETRRALEALGYL